MLKIFIGNSCIQENVHKTNNNNEHKHLHCVYKNLFYNLFLENFILFLSVSLFQSIPSLTGMCTHGVYNTQYVNVMCTINKHAEENQHTMRCK